MATFHGQIEKVLDEQAEVKAREQEIIVKCKNLDEVTSQFNKWIKKAYGGTQTVIISLVQSVVQLKPGQGKNT